MGTHALVPHRHVVLIVPRRLRAYFSYDRRRLSPLSRVAYRTLRDVLGAALGEREAAPGAIVGIQSFGVLVHWHPHLHVLMTDGAFRRDGTFLPAPAHEPAVLAAFMRAGWLESEAATAMLGWPHSGFGAHVCRAAGRVRGMRTRGPRQGGRKGGVGQVGPIGHRRRPGLAVRITVARASKRE